MVPYAALVDERNRSKSRPTGGDLYYPPRERPSPDQGLRADQGSRSSSAALTDVTRDEIVDRAVAEYAIRHADDTATGIDRGREILAGGDVAVAAHLLGESPDSVARVSG